MPSAQKKAHTDHHLISVRPSRRWTQIFVQDMLTMDIRIGTLMN